MRHLASASPSPAAFAPAALVVVVVAVAVAVAAWLVLRHLRHRRLLPRRAPRLRHPVVLAHGLFGYDEIEIAGVRSVYFRGLTAELSRHTGAVHRPRVAAAGSIAARAEELAACIRA